MCLGHTPLQSPDSLPALTARHIEDQRPLYSPCFSPKPPPSPSRHKVIEETNGFYKKLIAGESKAGKLWLK